MQQRIREPIARRALDCVLETSSQYGVWIATVGVESQQPVRLYHQLQHLADSLEATVNAPDTVVEFEKKDANLLASCAIFSMCNLVASMQDGVTGERYQEVNAIMRELYAVAIEFATDTVRLIPRLDGKKFLPEDVRKIIDAINAKVRSGTIRRMPHSWKFHKH